MTSQQLADDELRRFRNPIEERTFFAVNDLDSSTARIDEIMRTTEGRQFLREEFERIAPNVNRLVEIIAALDATVYEAAE